MCPDPRQIEHAAQLRLALIEAYRAGGLRDVEKRARDIIAKRCAEPIPDDLICELDNLYNRAMPSAENGRIDLYTDHPTVCDWIPNASERCAFALLAYLTRGGTSIEPLLHPAKAFNDEFRDNMDERGHLKPDSRMGLMSDGSYARVKARAKEAGELWLNNCYMHPSQVALVALSKYGTELPDFLHWRHDANDDTNDGDVKRFAGVISRNDLVHYDENGRPVEVNHQFDAMLVDCFRNHRNVFDKDWRHFRLACGALFDATGRNPYLMIAPDAHHASIDPETIPGFEKVIVNGETWYVHERYIIWLASLENWDDVAGGLLNAAAVADSLI